MNTSLVNEGTVTIARPRDELFEALCEVCGWDWRDMTRSSRGRVNAALVELREVEATGDDIRACAKAYESVFENATLTPQALVAHWPELRKVVKGYRRPRYYDALPPALEHEDAVPPPPELLEQIREISEAKSLPWGDE